MPRKMGEIMRPGDAGAHATRRVARLALVPAEAAFLYNAGLLNLDAGAVGTGGHAVLAADAPFLVYQHHARVGRIGGMGGTHRLAGSVLAVHALHWHHFRIHVGADPLLHLVEFDERLIGLEPVHHLTGHAAGVAANALLRVDEHSVAGHQPSAFLTFTATSWLMVEPTPGSKCSGTKSIMLRPKPWARVR